MRLLTVVFCLICFLGNSQIIAPSIDRTPNRIDTFEVNRGDIKYEVFYYDMSIDSTSKNNCWLKTESYKEDWSLKVIEGRYVDKFLSYIVAFNGAIKTYARFVYADVAEYYTFYKNGNIKLREVYNQGAENEIKKNGYCYYFSKNGVLEKVQYYRKGKIKKEWN